MPDEFELSRRKALAALGTVGVASAGAGLGTSAFFSDQETFENNQLTAGTLDMKVSWEEHYSDWSEDEAEHAHMEDGELVVDDRQGFMNATLQERFPDKRTRRRLDEGTADPCEVLADVPDDLEKPVIELEDVKPGDFGEVTFDFALCDNPGYVWLNGEPLSNAENGLTEPEADDPDEEDDASIQQLPGNFPGNGELADTIETTVWYDDDCDNTPYRDTPCLSRRELDGEEPPQVCTVTVTDVPDECEWLEIENEEIYIPCDEGLCPVDKTHVWVVNQPTEGAPPHAACRVELTPRGVGCHDLPDDATEVWEWTDDWTDEPCAIPQSSGCACQAEFRGLVSEPGCEWFEELDEFEDTIWLECGPETRDCDDRLCPFEEDGLHDIWFRNPANPDEICLVTIEVVDEDCRPVDNRVWEVEDDWNRQREREIFHGSLRETMEVLSQGHGLPLDGRPVTPFAETVNGEPASGAATTRECYAPRDRHCIGFKWELPVDHGNEVQSDSVSFDLGFYTEQCRHNDGAGMNDEPVGDDDPAL